MRFVDIDEAISTPDGAPASLEHAQPLSVEAQEAENQRLYEHALTLHSTGLSAEAINAYCELLAQDLIAGAEDAGSAQAVAESGERPALHLKFLALRNLAELKEANGALEEALELTLAALKLQEHDSLLWQRLGALALHMSQRHLARFSFERAIACSPHHQLAAMRLRQLLASFGDNASLHSLHASFIRSLPHLAPHLEIPSPGRKRSAASLRTSSEPVEGDEQAAQPGGAARQHTESCPRAPPKQQRVGQNAGIEALVVEVLRPTWAAVARAIQLAWQQLSNPSATLDTATPHTQARADSVASSSTEATERAPFTLGRRLTLVLPPPVEPVPVHVRSADDVPIRPVGLSLENSSAPLIGSPAEAARERSVFGGGPLVDSQEQKKSAHAEDEIECMVVDDTSKDEHEEEPEIVANEMVAAAIDAALLAASQCAPPKTDRPRRSRERAQPERASRQRRSASTAEQEASKSNTGRRHEAPPPPTPREQLAELLTQFTGLQTPDELNGCLKEITHVSREAIGSPGRRRRMGSNSSTVTAPSTLPSAAPLACELTATIDGSPDAEPEASKDEEEQVRAWLASALVVANSGVLHVAALYFDRVLSPSNGMRSLTSVSDAVAVEADAAQDGRLMMRGAGVTGGSFAWLVMAVDSSGRSRLGRAVLQLYESLTGLDAMFPLEDESGHASQTVLGRPMRGAREGLTLHQLEAAVALAELQVDAAVIGCEIPLVTQGRNEATTSEGARRGTPMAFENGSAAQRCRAASRDSEDANLNHVNVSVCGRRSSKYLHELCNHLGALEGRMKWEVPHHCRRSATDEQRTYSSFTLWVRLLWTRARCEELSGFRDNSIKLLAACRDVLREFSEFCVTRLGQQVVDSIHPIPLLQPLFAVDDSSLSDAIHRQTEDRVLRQARMQLHGLAVASKARAASEWICELHANAMPACNESIVCCLDAWKSVCASALTESEALLAARADLDAQLATAPSLSASQSDVPSCSLSMRSDANTRAVNMANDEASPLNASLQCLHVCWIGVCTLDAPRSRTCMELVAGRDGPITDTEANAAHANGTCAAERSPPFLEDLLKVYDFLFQGALQICTTALAESFRDQCEVDGQKPSSVRPSASDLQRSRNTDYKANVQVLLSRLEQRVITWVINLIQSLDAYTHTLRRLQSKSGHDFMSSGGQSAAQPTGSRSGGESCYRMVEELSVTQLLSRVDALARYASTRQPVHKELLHLSLTCFAKLWILHMRRTSTDGTAGDEVATDGLAQSLLLLRGSWQVLMNAKAMMLPIEMDAPLPPSTARENAREGGRSCGRGAKAAFVRPRQAFESPFVQLCLDYALKALSPAANAVGAGSRRAALAEKMPRKRDDSSSKDQESKGQEEDKADEEVGDPVELVDERDAQPSAGDGVGMCDAGGDATPENLELDNAALKERAETFRILEAAFRRARNEATPVDAAVEGAAGWNVRWKPRLRRSAGGVAGDAYLDAPSGETIRSVANLETFLGLRSSEDSMTVGAATLPLAMTRAPRSLKAQQRRSSDEKPAGKESGSSSTTEALTAWLDVEGLAEPRTVRDGWESLLQAAGAFLYGTRADVLSPAVRTAIKPADLDADKARHDDRRRALLAHSSADKRIALEFAARLCPPLPTLLDVGGPLGMPAAAMDGAFLHATLHHLVARRVSEARVRELKALLLRLLPAEAFPTSKRAENAQAEGDRLWISPLPLPLMPEPAKILVQDIGPACESSRMLLPCI